MKNNELLKEIRSNLTKSIKSSKNNSNEKHEINFQEFCRNFKESWLYSNNQFQTKKFKKASGSYFVLFQKNLSVTNIQIAELVSLLRFHTYNKNDGKNYGLDFFSDEQYTNFIYKLFSSLLVKNDFDNRDEALDAIDKLIKNFPISYCEILNQTIILDYYYTSAIFHIPKSLKVNLKSVTYESGYIHSSGPVLYVRNIEKVEFVQLQKRLINFSDCYKNGNSKLFLVPYADEYFSPYEKNTPVSIRNGLDGIRIKLRKHFIGEISLLEALSSLPELTTKDRDDKFNEERHRYFVPFGLKDFDDERKEAIEKKSCDSDVTVWVINDFSVIDYSHDTVARKGDEAYMVVYAQFFINNNQFNLFKERKPAWYASVTLPHTLSAAAINIARSSWTKNNEASKIILDPFCGTGTTLIDSAIRIPNSKIIGFDKEKSVPQIILDNWIFFSKDYYKLKKVHDRFKLTTDWLEDEANKIEFKNLIADAFNNGETDYPKVPNKNSEIEVLKYAVKVIGKEVNLAGSEKKGNHTNSYKNIIDNGFSNEFINILESDQLSITHRFFIYAIWRAFSLGTFATRYENGPYLNILIEEFKKITAEYQYLMKTLKPPQKRKKKNQVFKERIDSYSKAGFISPEYIRKIMPNVDENSLKNGNNSKFIVPANEGVHVFLVDDSITALEKFNEKVDLIITDPPYGFNTSEGGESNLQDLFDKLIPVCITKLKKGGQLILILPALAKNGRQIPFYETHAAIVRQILCSSRMSSRSQKKKNKQFDLVQINETFPGDRKLFEYPLYWNSATVLERRIVRFMLK